MANLGCLIKDTDLINDIKDVMRDLAGIAIDNGSQFTVAAAYNYLRSNGVEIDVESVASMYEDIFDLHDGNFNSQDEVDDIAGRSFNDTLNNLLKMQPRLTQEQIGNLSPGKQVAANMATIFRNANVTDVKTQTVMKMFEKMMKKAALAAINKSALPEKAEMPKKTFSEIIDAAFDLDNQGYRTLSGSMNSAEHVYNEFQEEVKKYLSELVNNGADPARVAQFASFAENFIRKGYSLLLSKKEMKDVVTDALIDAGFSREVTRNGVQTKALDWKKLTGAVGSSTYLRDNVEKVFERLGYSPEQVDRISEALENQYIDLRANIIKKSKEELARQQAKPLKELNRRNKLQAHRQAINSRRLAELYTYGLFDATPNTYEQVLNSLFGMSDFDLQTFGKLKVLSKSLQTLYNLKIDDTPLAEVQLKSAIKEVNEQIGQLLRDSSNSHSTLLKMSRTVQSVLDASFRFLLTGIKNMGLQNPLSGKEAQITALIQSQMRGDMTPELKKQNRFIMRSVFRDMALNGGIHFGDVNTNFINRGRLDEMINNLSDNQIYHAIVGTLIGRTGLDAMDSKYKASITQTYLVHNLLKVLTNPRKDLKTGTALAAMSKEDAMRYVSENLTGQSYADAQRMALDTITKINAEAGKQVLSPNKYFVNRFADDIVKGQLIANGKITQEQLDAAFDSAYKAAGRDLGHVPNNPLSLVINLGGNYFQNQLDKSIKNKNYNAAAMNTMAQIFFRNFMNPFVGGATNWITLKAEKAGLGLVTGPLSLKFRRGGKIDMMSESGMQSLSDNMYKDQRAWNKIYRGAVGAASSAILYGVIWASLGGIFGGDDDKERRRRFNRWRSDNRWASKYMDEFTPDWILAQMAAENDKLAPYVVNYMSWNDNYSSTAHFINYLYDRDKGKYDLAKGELGTAIGSKINLPIPAWRLVKDIVELEKGLSGHPAHYDFSPSKSLGEGFFKYGFLEAIGAVNKKPEPAPVAPRKVNINDY